MVTFTVCFKQNALFFVGKLIANNNISIRIMNFQRSALQDVYVFVMVDYTYYYKRVAGTNILKKGHLLTLNQIFYHLSECPCNAWLTIILKKNTQTKRLFDNLHYILTR